MDTKLIPPPVQRSFEDFEPPYDWVGDDQSEILLVDLRGFNKEHLKVQMDNNRNLKISGERPLGGNRWSRFRKDFRVKETLNVSEIRAKFESEVLYVILPKLITPAQASPASEKAKPSVAEQEATQKARGEAEAPRAPSPPPNEKVKPGLAEQKATQMTSAKTGRELEATRAQVPPASEKARPDRAQQQTTLQKAAWEAEAIGRRQDNGKAATETKPGGAQQETTLQKAAREAEAVSRRQDNGKAATETKPDGAQQETTLQKAAREAEAVGSRQDNGKAATETKPSGAQQETTLQKTARETETIGKKQENGQEKEKDRAKEVVDTGKVSGASLDPRKKEVVEEGNGKGPAWNGGGRLAVRLRSRQLLLNVAVAIIVLGLLGMYFYRQVTKATAADDE